MSKLITAIRMSDKSHAANAKSRATQMEKQGKLSSASKEKIDTKANRVLGNKTLRGVRK